MIFWRIKRKILYLTNKWAVEWFFNEKLLMLLNLFKGKCLNAKLIDSKGPIVIWNIDSFGDSLWITPTLDTLKRCLPDRPLVLFCNQSCIDLFKYNPTLSKVVSIKAQDYYGGILLLKHSQELKQYSHGDLIILEMGSRPADAARIMGRRYGFKNIVSSNLGILKNYSTHLLDKNSDENPQWWPEHFQNVLSFFKFKTMTLNRPNQLYIYTSNEELQNAIKIINDEDKSNTINIIVHPMVAKYGLATKKWPDSYFHEFMLRLHRHHKSRFLVTGSPDEKEACTNFISALKSIDSTVMIENLAGKLKILELYEVIKRSHLVICADTSILHLAIAAKKNTIAIFGATNHRKISPQHLDHIRSISLELPCSPCHKNKDTMPFWPKCIYSESRCLTELTPEIVWDKSSSLLKIAFAGEKET